MTELLIVAASIYAFGLVSVRLSNTAITAPMFFTTVGIAVGSNGLDFFTLPIESESVSILVEATLVLVLFTDAVRINFRELRRESGFPARLLGIGLPLTIILGMLVAKAIFVDFTWTEAALLSAVLAPTDAALGQAVVSDKRLPVRIRQGLNVESGLNDGIMVPVVTVLLALAASDAGGGADRWSAFAAQQIGFGVAAGVAIGCLGGSVLHRRSQRGAVEPTFLQLSTIAVAVSAFSAAKLVDGNGFIAVFVAGIGFGILARDQREAISDFTRDEGELLNALTFLVFGAVFAGPALADLEMSHIVYGSMSLIVIRLISVCASLVGSGMLIETRLFAGWFGPRGLATILFALLIVEELDSPQAETIFLTATMTVLLSIFLHGASASAWSGRLAARLHGAPEDQMEMLAVPEMPTRYGYGPEPTSDEQ